MVLAVRGGGGMFCIVFAEMPMHPPACQALHLMVFACRRIPPKFVKGALRAITRGGHPRKTYCSVHEALDDVFKPILVPYGIT